jgi:hypothetical protein
LQRLRRVLNGDVESRTVTEKTPYRIAAIANDEKQSAHASIAQTLDDVL